MPYYKDLQGCLHFLDSAEFEYLLPMGCLSISDVQAEAMRAPTAEQLLIASAQMALSAGLSIKSASSPELDGTFACDRLSQMDIIAIETGLNAGKGFPGGASTFSYPDMSGVMHPFSEAQFANFAASVRDYVYALNSVVAGASTTLPPSSVTVA